MPTQFFDTVKNGLTSIATGVLSAILVVIGIIIKVVDKGHVGIRMIFGKPVYSSRRWVRSGWRVRLESCERHMMVVGPGLKLMIPGFFYIRDVDARMQTLDLGVQDVRDDEGRMHRVALTAQIRHEVTTAAIEQSEFGVTDSHGLTAMHLRNSVVSAIGKIPPPELRDKAAIADLIKEGCSTIILKEIGLVVEKVLWANETPTDAQQNYDAVHGGLSRVADALQGRLDGTSKP